MNPAPAVSLSAVPPPSRALAGAAGGLGGGGLLSAALAYAARGWQVFPCRPGQKIPATAHGCHDASREPETIRRWWAAEPAANIAIACGPSGLLAVDLDTKHGADGLAAWAALTAGRNVPETMTARTPSGGRHLIFRAPEGVRLKSTAGKLGTGIDTRADGGYVVAPPSRTPAGVYEFVNACEPAAAPAWLVETLARPEPKEAAPAVPQSRPAAHPYAVTALVAEIESVARSPEGQRNSRLNEAAFKLGTLVGSGALNRASVTAALVEGAIAAGLPEAEAQAVARRALADGERHPRDLAGLSPVEPPAAGGFPEIVRAGEFTAAPLPPPPEIIGGVLHKGAKAVYGGPSKACKTWVLLDLALAVSSGRDWLGFPCAEAPVLYLNFELQPFALHKRLRAIADARRIPIPDTLHVWNLRGYVRPLPEIVAELRRRANGEGYGLVIPDPIYKALQGRDENKAGDIGALCGELDALAVETGAAVAFGAHFAKGNAAGKDALDRIAGSGVFARDPDAIITATAHAADGAFTLDFILRNFAPVEPFAVRWSFPLMTRDTMLDPADLKQPRARRAAPAVDMETVRAAGEKIVAGGPLPVALFDARFSRAAKLGEKAARAAKAELLAAGALALTGREPSEGGRKYIGTPDAVAGLQSRWARGDA